jgi:hypothetical protein
MFREILKKNARQIRFFSALVLCVIFIAASPTSPSDDSGCGSMSDTSGTIIVQNYSNARVYVTVNGPTSQGFQLTSGYQKTISATTGSYSVVAEVDQWGSPWDGQTIYSRSFTLSDSETETCKIYNY